MHGRKKAGSFALCIARLVAGTILVLAGAGCHMADRQPESGTNKKPLVVSVSGSNTMLPLIGSLALAFEALHPDIDISIAGGGSRRGLAELHSGAADIAMVARNLYESEQSLLPFPIARDGLAIIVRQDNPVTHLTSSDLRAIYAGRLTSWHSLDGTTNPIFRIGRENDRSSLEQIARYLGLPLSQAQGDLVAGDNAAAYRAVLAHPHSIAYVSLGESERQASAGMPIKLLDIDGIRASSETVSDGQYPLVRPLMLVTRELPAGAVKQFIEFCLSTHAAGEIARFDFTPYRD